MKFIKCTGINGKVRFFNAFDICLIEQIDEDHECYKEGYRSSIILRHESSCAYMVKELLSVRDNEIVTIRKRTPRPKAKLYLFKESKK